jgi:molybdate transport system substrate-binding protein
MHNKALIGILLISLPFLFSSCRIDTPKNTNKLRIAVAANFQYAMEELVRIYEQTTGQDIEYTTGSSGKLTAQIKNGAPFDIFLSANRKYPEALEKEGLTAGPIKNYAQGSLVLWTTNLEQLESASILEDQSITTIAIANPLNAPYGKAAEEVLKSQFNYEVIQPKLVYGESIAQVNQFIDSQSANLGFTSKSVVVSKMKDKGHWIEIPSSLYSPIEQGVVLLKYAEDDHLEAAQAFINFLLSDEAKQIMSRYGYQ